MSTFQPIVEYATSADGTRIGYLRQGTGPGIVLIQGAMADVHAYQKLAIALSDSFTVFSADRRGRGLSPRPYDHAHDISRDVEDVDAIMAQTGATSIFGLSSGAVIALEATRSLDRVQRAVFYEPPFYEDGIDHAGIARLNAEIEADDLPSSLVDALQVAGTAPAIIRYTPRPAARLLAKAVIAVNSRQSGPAATFKDLLPGIRYDFHDVAQAQDHIESYARISKPVLLLSGTASPMFLRQATLKLAALIPAAQHIEFNGLGHDGPWNSGNPSKIADAIKGFCKGV